MSSVSFFRSFFHLDTGSHRTEICGSSRSCFGSRISLWRGTTGVTNAKASCNRRLFRSDGTSGCRSSQMATSRRSTTCHQRRLPSWTGWTTSLGGLWLRLRRHGTYLKINAPKVLWRREATSFSRRFGDFLNSLITPNNSKIF